MKTPRRYFWSSWPMDSQRRFFKIMLYGVLLGTISVVIGMHLFRGALEKEIMESREQYGRVVPLVDQIQSLRALQGDLAHLPVDDALWQIIDDLGIEKDMRSMRTTSVDDAPAIQVTFDGLSLTQLMHFLQMLRDRASLQTPQCVLTRNSDDPRLADAHFVLSR